MGNNPETRGLQAWIANQLEKSPRISGFLALYTQYHVQRDEPNSYFEVEKHDCPITWISQGETPCIARAPT